MHIEHEYVFKCPTWLFYLAVYLCRNINDTKWVLEIMAAVSLSVKNRPEDLISIRLYNEPDFEPSLEWI